MFRDEQDLEEARSLFEIKRISPSAAKAVVKEDVLDPLSLAMQSYEQATSPWTFIWAKDQGLQPMGIGRSELKKLSQSEKQEALEHIEKARQHIETSLRSFEKHAREHFRRNRVVRFALIGIGVLLVVAGVFALLWGVLRGSQIKLIGKDGAASFCILLGIALLRWVYMNDFALRTIPDRVRAKLDACLANPEYADVHKCFGDALKLLDVGIKELGRLARETTG